jgi:hypothetical protein
LIPFFEKSSLLLAPQASAEHAVTIRVRHASPTGSSTYTAISRTGDPTGLAVLLPPDRSSNTTNNVVFQRIVRIMTVAGPSNSDHVHADVEDNDRVLSCPLMTMACTDADHAICIALTNEPSEVDDMALSSSALHTPWMEMTCTTGQATELN